MFSPNKTMFTTLIIIICFPFHSSQRGEFYCHEKTDDYIVLLLQNTVYIRAKMNNTIFSPSYAVFYDCKTPRLAAFRFWIQWFCPRPDLADQLSIDPDPNWDSNTAL